ncbi:MAG: hypothetical protein Q9O24_09235 [Gammaproteobacteria bacterium]|nr:hypothetical protein [Gammaproteobacteria bacterium]
MKRVLFYSAVLIWPVKRLQRAQALIATESWQIARSVVVLRQGLLALAMGKRDEALRMYRDPELLECGTMVLPFLPSVQQLRQQLAFELGEANKEHDALTLQANIKRVSDASCEFDLLLFARRLLQRGEATAVLQLLEAFLPAAEAQQRRLSALEARILIALAQQQLGKAAAGGEDIEAGAGCGAQRGSVAAVCLGRSAFGATAEVAVEPRSGRVY